MPVNGRSWGFNVSEILPQSGEISRGVFKCRENRGDVTCLGVQSAGLDPAFR